MSPCAEQFVGEVTPIADVVSDADYAATIARAYLAAPPVSVEEIILEDVLRIACKRIGIDVAELLERMCSTSPVVSESEFSRG